MLEKVGTECLMLGVEKPICREGPFECGLLGPKTSLVGLEPIWPPS